MRFLFQRTVGLLMAGLGCTSLLNARKGDLAYAASHHFVPHNVVPYAIMTWILTWGLILLLSPNATLELVAPTSSMAPTKFFLFFGSIALSVAAAHLYIFSLGP